jgi:hypothetical protein
MQPRTVDIVEVPDVPHTKNENFWFITREADGKFAQEKTKILSYYTHNNYKTIIKIIDDELKEYYEIKKKILKENIDKL